MATRSFKILTSPTNVAAGFWCFSRVKKKQLSLGYCITNCYALAIFTPWLIVGSQFSRTFAIQHFFFLSRYVDFIELRSQKPWGAFFNWVIVSDHSITTSHRVSSLNKKNKNNTWAKSAWSHYHSHLLYKLCIYHLKSRLPSKHSLIHAKCHWRSEFVFACRNLLFYFLYTKLDSMSMRALEAKNETYAALLLRSCTLG